MTKIKKVLSQTVILFLIVFLIISCAQKVEQKWEPNTDWGHWILGHRTDLAFLEKNNMTVTFGTGAPNVDEVTRAEFDEQMEEAANVL